MPGHWVTVCTGAETYAAKALSIDDAGRLVVEREGGRQVALQHGEVSIRRQGQGEVDLRSKDGEGEPLFWL